MDDSDARARADARARSDACTPSLQARSPSRQPRPVRRPARPPLAASLLTLGSLLFACAPAESGGEAAEGEMAEQARAGETPSATAGESADAAQEAGLPPGGDGARAHLEASPRHGEWAVVPAGAGDSVRAWVVHPERSDAAPVVVVIHEIYGLTSWIRAVADQLAAEGFLAIAPDLLTGRDVPTDEAGDPEREAAVREIRNLPDDEVHRRLSAAAEWGMALPSTTDRYGVVGFCWGGSTSFDHATRVPELDAAVVYYGSSPPSEALTDVEAPVLGHYGGADDRVTSTVPRADSVMTELGKMYETQIHEGSGHGFLRQQDGREGANAAAAAAAWPRTIQFFRTHLEAESGG